MTEEAVAPSAAPTAGALLRQAREAQGLHIAALAASLKVPPAKLEALERDRYQDLPDATFARALAQTVCRALKIDAAPVLALMPRTDTGRLEHVSEGLNAPFRERPTASEPAIGGLLARPALWIVAVLLLAALAVYFWPATVEPPPATPVALEPVPVVPEPAASEALAPAPDDAASQADSSTVPLAPAAPVAADVPASAAPPEAAASTPATAGEAPAVQGLLVLRATEASWIEVVDAGGRSLLSRTVQAGEAVGLDGRPPLRLTIGNAGATQVSLRGEPVALEPHTRDNIARLVLK